MPFLLPQASPASVSPEVDSKFSHTLMYAYAWVYAYACVRVVHAHVYILVCMFVYTCI